MRPALAILCAVLASCATHPTNGANRWMESERNACLPTAIAFREGLKGKAVWSEVIQYSYVESDTKAIRGHAICAYLYPIGKNQLWTYDFQGSSRVRAFIANPIAIAQESEEVRGRPQNRVIIAEFLK